MTYLDARQPRFTARRVISLWYFVVPAASLGLFAVLPFVHAAAKLRQRFLWSRVAIFAAVDAVLLISISVVPTNAAGSPVGTTGDLIMTIVVMGCLATLITACVQLGPLRRRVYQLDAALPARTRATDPAIAQALSARNRRDETRQLVARDPLLTHDLLIGRPDLTGHYNDGGLVDLNSAPAPVIAEICGLDQANAARIVEARAARGAFSSLDEVLVLVDLPVDAWDRVRDRGITLT